MSLIEAMTAGNVLGTSLSFTQSLQLSSMSWERLGTTRIVSVMPATVAEKQPRHFICELLAACNVMFV